MKPVRHPTSFARKHHPPPPRLKRLFLTPRSPAQEVNALNRLALEGVLAVIESISRRCGPSSQPPPSSQPGGPVQAGGLRSPPLPFSGPHSEGLSLSLGGPDSSRRGSASDSDSDQEYIAAFGGGGSAVLHGRMGCEGDSPFNGGAARAGELGWLERARARTAEVLQERKKMKRRLGLAARKFNTGSKGWLEYAQVSVFSAMIDWAGSDGFAGVVGGRVVCGEHWGIDKAAAASAAECVCGRLDTVPSRFVH